MRFGIQPPSVEHIPSYGDIYLYFVVDFLRSGMCKPKTVRGYFNIVAKDLVLKCICGAASANTDLNMRPFYNITTWES